MSEPRLVEVRRNVLKQNDVIARRFVSSSGPRSLCGESGFQSWVRQNDVPREDTHPLAASVSCRGTGWRPGDRKRRCAPGSKQGSGQADYNGHGLPSRSSDGSNALQGWDLNQLDFLFIENVGNLVCPSSYDLGENLRLVLMSVTEGEDKPLKYPTIFNSADVAVISKNELAAAVEFDWETARKSIESVRPGMQIFRLSAKTGEGMEDYLEFLSARLAENRAFVQS